MTESSVTQLPSAGNKDEATLNDIALVGAFLVMKLSRPHLAVCCREVLPRCYQAAGFMRDFLSRKPWVWVVYLILSPPPSPPA